MVSNLLHQHKEFVALWFEELRNEICTSYEILEKEYDGVLKNRSPGSFQRQVWKRKDIDGGDGGGGVVSIMKGRVFEKVGVNISTVWGQFSPEFASSVPGANHDPRFWASGISIVAHPHSPHVPAVHFNTRFITTTKFWFGGGGDMTPTISNTQDTKDFHAAFAKACDLHNPNYYKKFKKWCDEYFFIKHRQEPRGVGGIFFDNHNSGNWNKDFAFVKDVGRAFRDIVPQIYRRRMNLKWSAQEREALLIKRGRYVEFNLIYDRGTLFGLKTGGNVEAVLMSLPPEAKWS